MKMLDIPEERRERIAREEEKYQKEKFITESSSEASNELELEETWQILCVVDGAGGNWKEWSKTEDWCCARWTIEKTNNYWRAIQCD